MFQPEDIHLENWTDSGRIYNFKRTEIEMKSYSIIVVEKNLLTSMNGKLYRCPFAANADSFKGIPLDQRNSIPINSTAEEIERYTRELNLFLHAIFARQIF